MARPDRIIEFGTPPRDLDRDAPLAELRKPSRTRGEAILSPQLDRQIDRIEAEFRAIEDLARRGLSVRSRLLLIGPPGCGKTLCAEILAGELGLPLLYARFDAIVSSYLGETASNIRRIFQYAARSPVCLFFDEFDVLGKQRDDAQEVGELKRVVGSFLQILDSHPRDRLVIAATNHHGLLDEALWRRFDEVLSFEMPTIDQVARLVELRLRGVRKVGIDIRAVAERMSGFSFADAEKVCLEAAKAMVLDGRRELTAELIEAELEDHLRRVALGRGPRS